MYIKPLNYDGFSLVCASYNYVSPTVGDLEFGHFKTANNICLSGKFQLKVPDGTTI